jgi:GNAT superfamily N-acetyltransferase
VGIAMGAELDAVDVDAAAPRGVAVEQVADDRALGEWIEVARACAWFEDDAHADACERLFRSLGLGDGAPLRHWVARSDGRAVGMASAFVAGDVLLLVHVAVLEGVRRRGIGRALAGERLRAGRSARCRAAVLAPSPDGSALYASLGFGSATTPARRRFYLPLTS